MLETGIRAVFEDSTLHGSKRMAPGQGVQDNGTGVSGLRVMAPGQGVQAEWPRGKGFKKKWQEGNGFNENGTLASGWRSMARV